MHRRQATGKLLNTRLAKTSEVAEPYEDYSPPPAMFPIVRFFFWISVAYHTFLTPFRTGFNAQHLTKKPKIPQVISVLIIIALLFTSEAAKPSSKISFMNCQLYSDFVSL